MFSYISGSLTEWTEDGVVLETGGVGFFLHVSARTLDRLPGRNAQMKLYTYLMVREDDLQLFGFPSRDELTMFTRMLAVSGIGPKGALAILSTLSLSDLAFAIAAQDAKSIAKAPGIGKKTAEKLILELRDKKPVGSGGDEQALAGVPAASSQNRQDAVEALVALGYGGADALKAVAKVKDAEEKSAEAIIKEALRVIG